MPLKRNLSIPCVHHTNHGRPGRVSSDAHSAMHAQLILFATNGQTIVRAPVPWVPLVVPSPLWAVLMHPITHLQLLPQLILELLVSRGGGVSLLGASVCVLAHLPGTRPRPGRSQRREH